MAYVFTDENAKEAIESGKPVVIDFWAEWCGPCKRFGPIFEATSEEHPEVTFGKVDTEANQELAAALQIQSIPTIMMFRDGVLLAREAGMLPKEALNDLISQAEKLDMDEVRKQVEEQMKQAEAQQEG